MKELDRDKLLEIVRIKLIGCQPCNGCELKNHCPLPQAHKQTKQLISQQERQVDEEYIEEKARGLTDEIHQALVHGRDYENRVEITKDFIRSIIKDYNEITSK